jgi:hypothetical protein
MVRNFTPLPSQAERIGSKNSFSSNRVNLVDLFRIKGVAEKYSDLLEEAGIDIVVELSKRVPENLPAKMLEVNKSFCI